MVKKITGKPRYMLPPCGPGILIALLVALSGCSRKGSVTLPHSHVIGCSYGGVDILQNGSLRTINWKFGYGSYAPTCSSWNWTTFWTIEVWQDGDDYIFTSATAELPNCSDCNPTARRTE